MLDDDTVGSHAVCNIMDSSRSDSLLLAKITHVDRMAMLRNAQIKGVQHIEHQVGHLARDHQRRIVREDGLAISIRQMFDRNGRPPPDVTLATILRLHRMLEKQHGWLRAIVVELHDHLKTLDHMRYRKENAGTSADLISQQKD